MLKTSPRSFRRRTSHVGDGTEVICKVKIRSKKHHNTLQENTRGLSTNGARYERYGGSPSLYALYFRASSRKNQNRNSREEEGAKGLKKQAQTMGPSVMDSPTGENSAYHTLKIRPRLFSGGGNAFIRNQRFLEGAVNSIFGLSEGIRAEGNKK